MLNIQMKQVEPDIVVLEVTGKITLGRACKELEWATEGLVRDNKKKVVFDLTGVTHVDSTGIGIIVMSAGQMKQSGGRLRVVCSKGYVQQVLNMTSVDKVVELYPTVAAATAGFSS